jgi:hypothetical protein
MMMMMMMTTMIMITAWGRVLLEMPIVVQLVKKFVQFMETDGSLTRLKEIAISTFPEEDESTANPHVPFL